MDDTIRAHPDTDLTPEQFERLRERLADEQGAVTASIASLSADLGVRPDCSIADIHDAAGYVENKQRAASLMQQHRDRLAVIEQAFERMRKGRYGISERSGEPIPFERLELVPWATTTVDD